MQRKPLLLAPIVAAALGACGARQSVAPPLPVTRVVLYQSGVAYLERAGTVSGEALTLPIRADQVNDILATLFVVDRGVEGATSVSLPIDPSAADQLADLPPELRDAGGMVSILAAFRGADVAVDAGALHMRGRVVGIEYLDDGPHVSILDRGDHVVPVRIADIDQVELLGSSLTTGLRRSLDHSLAQGDWKPTDVTVRFARAGEHDIALAYVVESPIWKPAYRAIIDDGSVLLQGWAVIDNTSGADWTDVRLSLAAGTPLSFRYDLHSPIYIGRPDMSGYGTPTSLDLRPPEVIAAQQRRPASAAAPAPASAEMRSRADYGRIGLEDDAAEMPPGFYDGEYATGGAAFSADTYGNAVGVSAGAERDAGIFRFDIPGRVTVPDQSSTMVTLVNERAGGEDALVFQPGSAPTSQSSPYRALMLDNATPYPVQPAPIAIYSRGSFVGQGVTPAIAPGESAVIPYAFETGVRIARRQTSASGEVTLTRIVDGVVYTETQYVNATAFEIDSALDDDERLYLRVDRLGGYELVDGDDFDLDDVQTEAAYYLVPVDVAATAEHTVTVEQRTRTSTTLDPLGADAKRVFSAYLSRPDARPDVAAALRPVVTKLEQLADIDRQYAEATRLQSDIQNRSAELRRNLAALGTSDANAELRRTLTERLSEQDDLSAATAGQIVALSEQRSALRVEVVEGLRAVHLN